MPKPMAEVGEGGLEGGSGKYGVYSFIRDLIVDGNGARFVNKEGRFVVNWPIALECYAEFKSKKNSKSKKIDKRKASNGLRAALLNFYKKEGAQEFKESKKVNEKDEVVERQFQMPPRIFKTLFADLPQTDDSEPDSISVVSEDEDGTPEAILETLEIHSHGSPHSSDTGFDEAMDISDGSPIMNTDETLCFGFAVDDFPSEEQSKQEDAVSLQDIPTPSQMFHLSEEEFDSAFKDILSDGISENDLDLSGVVQDISPSSGSVKGGQRFHILLSEQLPDDIISGVACFEGCGTVFLEKLNCSTLRGFLPAAQQAGPVPVIIHTQAGQYLGKTWFLYVDEVQEMLRQLVKDPAMQSMFFNLWAQEHGNVGSDGDLSQTLYPFIMQSQGSSYQTKSVQSLEVLQLLVYTAAQTDAQQFIHMIFDTSAGRTIFDAYKSRTPLPEDVARANGHQELAQFLQEITRRYSEESSSCGVQSRVIDWQELVQAVEQTQKQPPGTVESTQENDDNLSEYFADAETSSCGSFELDVHWSDSEDSGPSVIDNDSSSCMMPKSITNKESTITSDFKPDFANGDIGSQTACLDNKVSPSGERLISNYVHTDCGEPPDRGSTKERKKSQTTEVQSETSQDSANDQWKPSDTKIKKDALRKANPSGQETPNGRFGGQIFSRMFGWEEDSDDCTPGQQETTFVKEERKDRSYKPRVPPEPKSRRTSPRSSRRKSHLNSRIQKGGVLCAIIMLLLLAGFKLNDDWLLRWAVENGQTQIAKILVQCGCDVNAQNAQMRLPLHLAAQKGDQQIVELLLRHGSHIDVQDFMQQTPLHLAAQYGHQPIAEVLLQRGIDASAQDSMKQTPLHLAAQNGYKQITEVLLQRGSDASVQDFFEQTPLHLAAQNGHKQITDLLLQHGVDASAQDFMKQTPLHLAAQNGYEQVIEVLLQRGSDASTQNYFEQTSLHLAAQNGHTQVTEVLLQHGINVSAQDYMGQTPLHLAARNGHKQITKVLLQRGIDASTQDHRGQTSLHLAAQNGHKEITEVLLERGIDASTRDNSARYGHKQITEVLLQHGVNAFTQDYSGHTPLHLAAQNGHKEITEALLKLSSDASTLDNNGQTPLHLAARYGHKQITEVLLQRGIDASAQVGSRKTSFLLQNCQNVHSPVINSQTPLRVSEIFQQDGTGAEKSRRQTPLVSYDGERHITEMDGYPGMGESGRQHVRVLQHGNHSGAQDLTHQTPLHLTSPDLHRHNTEVQLIHGATLNLNMAACNGDEQTAVHNWQFKVDATPPNTTFGAAAEKGSKNLFSASSAVALPSAKDLEACSRCFQCSVGYLVQAECTRRPDAIPIGEVKTCLKLSRRESSFKPITSNTPTKLLLPTLTRHNKSVVVTNLGLPPNRANPTCTNNSYNWLLYGLGSLVAICTLAAIFSICYHRRQKRLLDSKEISNFTSGVAVIQRSSASVPALHTVVLRTYPNTQEQLYLPCPPAPLRHSKLADDTSSGLYHSQSSPLSALVQNLSLTINPSGRWKVLARELDIAASQISKFSLDPSMATEKMLSEWLRQVGSSPQVLHDKLCALQWKHEANIVNQYLNITHRGCLV